jgi:murein DD-endopeptidase MepM/ murein hydrolase activator NlpD
MNPIDYYRENGWRLTSPYGPRTGRYAGFHRGVDFGGQKCGAPIPTPYSGVVVAARTHSMGTWGNTVCIKLDGSECISLHAHLQRITVTEGEHIPAGHIIGTNGGTNHSGPDYACHIHYEILDGTGTRPWRGKHSDPALFYLVQQNDEKPEPEPEPTKPPKLSMPRGRWDATIE